MNHPSVVTLGAESAPRSLMAGSRLLRVKLPPGARCIYPKPSRAGFADTEGLVGAALRSPLGSEPLRARLRPGMKLTIVISAPLSPSPSPGDVRGKMVESVLGVARERHVDDIEIIIAGGVERKLPPSLVQTLLGARVLGEVRRVRNHDAEEREQFVPCGELPGGAPLELPRRILESDLVVGVSARSSSPLSPLEGLLRGLLSAGAMKAVTSAELARPEGACDAPELRLFPLLEGRVPLFLLDALVEATPESSSLSFLYKNEDELSESEKRALRVCELGSVPGMLRRLLARSERARVAWVYAGDPELVSERAVQGVWEQVGVPVQGQADVLIVPVGTPSGIGLGEGTDPLTAQGLGAGEFFCRFRGHPLLRPSGTLILLHPLSDRFPHQEQTASEAFVHELLPRRLPLGTLFAREKERFFSDPALIQMYRTGFAFHPLHSFTRYRASEMARHYAGRIIVVGADNESVPALFGFETARTLDEALYRASDGLSRKLEICCLKEPSLLLSEVSL